MSQASQDMRNAIDHSLSALEMVSFNAGFEACIEGIEEISNQLHNDGDNGSAETLRWLAKELRGDNAL